MLDDVRAEHADGEAGGVYQPENRGTDDVLNILMIIMHRMSFM